ncbi:MAG: ComF family protein [Firmicutes bacterium]|nr:ComF family protein [Bacillota bacterium]
MYNPQKQNLFKRIILVLFPRHLKCVCCNTDLPEKSEYAFCESCEKALPLNNGNVCTRCGVYLSQSGRLCLACKAHTANYVEARAPLRYKDKVPTLIRRFKYDNQQYLANVFGRLMLDSYLLSGWQADCIIPVPLFERRQKRRGYNQAYLLAKYISDKTQIPLDITNLVRIKDTPTQVKLTYKQRAQNLERAFKVLNKQELKGKTVLLIDDVITTTATINECALALNKAGVKAVYALSAARADQKTPMAGTPKESLPVNVLYN